MSGFVTTLHPARIVKRNLPADMAVLDFLPEVRVIVWKLCQSARYYVHRISGLESTLTNHVASRVASPALVVFDGANGVQSKLMRSRSSPGEARVMTRALCAGNTP